MRILVTLDHSERDRVTLQLATTFAGPFQATLVLLHIVPLTRSILPSAVREAHAYLLALQTGLREEDAVDCELVVRKGDPAREILAVAEDAEVDLIMMTTRGRRGLDRFVLGSVTETVLAKARKPVILLNENASRATTSERARLQSYYLASVVWNKRRREIYDDEQAVAQLRRLATLGLDREILESTYTMLAKEGAAPEWLDFAFQVKTLEQFFPEDLLVESDQHQQRQPRPMRAA
jgi:nucleotide-binding universal stress UspA family protein